MSAGSEGELRAASGAVFNELASQLASASDVVEAAICEGAMSPELMVCLYAMLRRAGMLADRAAETCGAGEVLSQDRWLMYEGLREHLAKLAAPEQPTAEPLPLALRVVDGQRPA